MALAAAPDVPGFRAPTPLGYGPASTIYSAQSDSLSRSVALTVYSAALSDERAQRRFRRGYEVARRLGAHPHAATVLELGLLADRRPFVATEIYARGTLDGRIEAGQPLDVSEALRIGIEVAGALETAQRAGVIHGGVHPARVLLADDGEAAVADLGLVPLVDRSGLAALVGPMAYHAPPEVLEGQPISPATDVYSLASTLYAALTGRAPFALGGQRETALGGADKDTTTSLLLRILQHELPPMNRDGIPASLDQALDRALSSEPRDRPSCPLAFAQMLQRCQHELGLPVTQPVVLDIPATLTLAPSPEVTPSAEVIHTPEPAPRHKASTHREADADQVFVPYTGPTPAPEAGPPPQALTPEPSIAPRREATLRPPSPPEALAPPPLPSVDPPVAPSALNPDPEAAPEQVDGTEPAELPRLRALPVMVLAALVVVIFAGVTWSIVTGDASEAERAQLGGTNNTPLDPTNGRSAATRSGLTAVENSSGVQLDWDGRTDEPQVVVILSTIEPPRTRPADAGTALLIRTEDLNPAAGYCFAVVPAANPLPTPAEIAADIPADALGFDACIRGGTSTIVLRQ